MSKNPLESMPMSAALGLLVITVSALAEAGKVTGSREVADLLIAYADRRRRDSATASLAFTADFLAGALQGSEPERDLRLVREPEDPPPAA